MSYPTTFPGEAINVILSYINGVDKDQKKLVHAFYDLIGYGLYITYNDTNAERIMQEVSAFTTGNPLLTPFLMQLLQTFIMQMLQKFLNQNNNTGGLGQPGPPFSLPAGVAVVPK